MLSKAIYIQYPININGYNTTYKIDNVYKLPLPNNKQMYSGWLKNHNHFTTEYHRLYSLPLLSKLLNFNFNLNDYILKENIIDNKFDISMLYPKNTNKFEIFGYTRNEYFDNLDYNNLLINDSKSPDITEYHRLFKYGHECSRIINKTINNNKKLFISGDSQMIPDIAVLCCYFKEVWYFDNRQRLLLSEKYKNIYFDYVLIQLNNNKIDFYINQNFM